MSFQKRLVLINGVKMWRLVAIVVVVGSHAHVVVMSGNLAD